MTTMKRARRDCPGTQTKRRPRKDGARRHVLDVKGRVIMDEATALTRPLYVVEAPRSLAEPLRRWARRVYAGHRPGSLSPKLRRIVFGT
jgi:hypothetical protein